MDQGALGSVSVVVDINDGLLSETMYKPWGETRYSGGAVMPTDRLYTGQIAEPVLGLYFYNVRWMDPINYSTRKPTHDLYLPLIINEER
ncbi:MAG: hypothetical protein KA928_05010 [Longilinea sp.]|jgi:hypothetical protein|nr:hypothetical protein [Longilinea sp.]HQF62051.1 hypothetical protein [Anaerolineaceae bacterium]HQH85273.1 hypothetical protein [Anaerolineaceae bacterium]